MRACVRACVRVRESGQEKMDDKLAGSSFTFCVSQMLKFW